MNGAAARVRHIGILANLIVCIMDTDISAVPSIGRCTTPADNSSGVAVQRPIKPSLEGRAMRHKFGTVGVSGLRERSKGDGDSAKVA
jgi:hypothetical protein